MTTKITNANITNTGVSAGSYTNTNLTVNAQGQITAASNGTGGGGTPGGSDTQVQFNDAGSFGGDAGLTYNKTTDTLTTSVVVHGAGTVSAPSITTTGDTNTGVYFPAADTAAITTGGTERVRVDSGGNVGIGVTPAASFWTGANVLQAGLGSMIIGQAANASAVEFSTNQFINAAGSARTYLTTGAVGSYQQSSGRHRLLSAASGSAGAALTLTTVLEVDKDKTLALQGGSSTTGAGIAFPATESLSTDANTLDDYEEGVFTPALNIGGATTGITYAGRAGKYTRIGNLVYVSLGFSLSSKGSLTGNLTITGLPFASANTDYREPYWRGTSNNFADFSATITSSATTLQVRNPTTTAAITDTTLANNSALFINGCYQV